MQAATVELEVTTGKMIRMNDDMITVTGNASNSIAFRNAVFSVIPKGITDICYNTAMEMITGDLSDESKLIKKRNDIVGKMKTAYNVTEDQILKSIGLRSINQIKAEQIADLISIGQAIKDGDTTVEQAFALIQPKTAADLVKERKEAIKEQKDNAKAGEQASIDLP